MPGLFTHTEAHVEAEDCDYLEALIRYVSRPAHPSVGSKSTETARSSGLCGAPGRMARAPLPSTSSPPSNASPPSPPIPASTAGPTPSPSLPQSRFALVRVKRRRFDATPEVGSSARYRPLAKSDAPNRRVHRFRGQGSPVRRHLHRPSDASRRCPAPRNSSLLVDLCALRSIRWTTF